MHIRLSVHETGFKFLNQKNKNIKPVELRCLIEVVFVDTIPTFVAEFTLPKVT